jgi:hypothetical protein
LDKFNVIESKLDGMNFQGVTQNWDKVLPASSRFVVLANFNNEAVRDNATGLVWERDPLSPGGSGQGDAGTADSWAIAANKCIRKGVGGQKGWRLPAPHEIGSLIDVSVSRDDVRLPPGHPFLNIGTDFYWTASTYAVDTSRAWVVRFLGGGAVTEDKSAARPSWCVRGSGQTSVY